MNNNESSLYRALSGLTIAIVGGDPREHSLARLRDQFDRSRIVHCPTIRNDASARAFEAALRRPDVVLVVWLCGLSRTNHGRQLRSICRRLDLPWVDCLRIPYPHILTSRIVELHLLDAIVRRRAQLVSVPSLGGVR